MAIEIIQGRADHPVQRVADLIWTTDSPLVDYLFMGQANWDRMVAINWPQNIGGICHSQSRLAVEQGEIVGIIVTHDPATMDRHFEASRERMKYAASSELARHFDQAFDLLGKLFPHPPASSHYVLDLAVDRQHHRRGIGRQLMESAIAEAKALGRRSVNLDVAGESEAVRFYRSLGMEVAIETKIPELEHDHGIGVHYHMTLAV
jgi:ribosomal protein S18 acetylase RimI-like enzyme